MAEQETQDAAMTAGDLGIEHYGLLVSWEEPTDWGTRKRTVVLDELRRWIYQGERRVGISDMTPTGGFIGTEYPVTAALTITVGRRIRKARKRPWSKAALKPGQTWEALEAQEGPQSLAVSPKKGQDQ